MKKISSMLALAAALSVLGLGGAAHAADSGWTTVTKVRSYGEGTTVVYVANAFNAGTCSSTTAFRINSASSQGQHLHSVVLAAFLSGRRIRAEFTGECTPMFNIANYVEME